MGMSKTSTSCSRTRWRMRSSGPSKGGSPGRRGGSVTRNASAIARAPEPATSPPVSESLAMPPPRLPHLHRVADLPHGPLRHRPRLRGPELDDVVEVLRPGEERLALLAHALLGRQQGLEQLLLAVDAADPGGPAVLVHPG